MIKANVIELYKHPLWEKRHPPQRSYDILDSFVDTLSVTYTLQVLEDMVMSDPQHMKEAKDDGIDDPEKNGS